MIGGGGIARRYVQPLFEVAQEKNELDKVSGDLKALDDSLVNHGELRSFLFDPSIERQAKKAAIKEIFEGISPFTYNFMRVVIDKNRTEIFLIAYRLFKEMVDATQGVLTGSIQSAVSLDDNTLSEIRKSLKERFKGDLDISTEVVPELIAGLKIQIGNNVIDASVRNHFEQLKEVLARA